jgi:hypothetical protein
MTSVQEPFGELVVPGRCPGKTEFVDPLHAFAPHICSILPMTRSSLARRFIPHNRGHRSPLTPVPTFRARESRPDIGVMHIDLTEEETAALIKEPHGIVEHDPLPVLATIRTLRAILAKLRPEPVRQPLPPPKRYAAASRSRATARLVRPPDPPPGITVCCGAAPRPVASAHRRGHGANPR